MSSGHEVSISQANLAKDDEFHDVEVAKNTADGTVEKIPSSLRLFRKINYVECKPTGWGRPMNLTMYIMYVLIAGLVSFNHVTVEPIPGIRVVGITCYGVWQFLNFLNSLYAWASLRQMFAWVGPYITLLDLALNVGTVLMFYYSFRDIAVGSLQLEYGLLIVMAGVSLLSIYQLSIVLLALSVVLLITLLISQAIYVDQRIVDPAFKNLYYYYNGAITKVELKGGVPPIAGISNSALLKIASAAGKALKFPDEAIETIQKEIGNLKIREGEQEALDDWTYTIYKLTRAVSFSPLYLKSSSKISAGQCQQLTVQMILFLR